MSVPKVHDKPTEINRLTVQQLLFEHVRLCQAFHGWKKVGGQHSGDLELNCMSACKTFLIVELLQKVRELFRRIAAWNQLNCRGSRPHSRTTHHEGVVILTPRIRPVPVEDARFYVAEKPHPTRPQAYQGSFSALVSIIVKYRSQITQISRKDQRG